MSKTVYLNNSYFRPNTKHASQAYNFFLTLGGLGDYLNWLPALQWIAEKCPQVKGQIFVNPPFDEVAKYLFKKYQHWKVHKLAFAPSIMKDNELIIDPKRFPIKYIFSTGAHLLDLGFMLYCNQAIPMSGYNRLPPIDYEGPWKWPDLDPAEPYAVFTPGATVDTRATPADAFNELVNYTISKGVKPVFLGKMNFSHRGQETGYFAKFKDGYDFTKGVDLREKTTLLESVQVMRGARFVIGVDNGLLHFAGTTEVPIIFGHTIARVEHRQIRRPKGLTVNIALSKETLPCIACQSDMRFILSEESKKGHRFSKCIYDDYKCLELLFSNNAGTWKKAIDHVLETVWGAK